MFFIRIKSPEAGLVASTLIRRLDPANIPWGILADLIASTVLADHHEATADGTDKDGAALIPITESTIQRRKRRGDGEGPPLAPNLPQGRATDATASIEVLAEGAEIIIRWLGAPWLRFHADGEGRYGRKIATRDTIGIRPATWVKIQGIVNDFARDLLAGTL